MAASKGTRSNGAEVTTDGTTVWVNARAVNLGRFGRYAVDVHKDEHGQAEEGTHCLDCFVRSEDVAADWARFREAMLRAHGVDVPDDYRPGPDDADIRTVRRAYHAGAQ